MVGSTYSLPCAHGQPSGTFGAHGCIICIGQVDGENEMMSVVGE